MFGLNTLGIKVWAYILSVLFVLGLGSRVYSSGKDAKAKEDLDKAIDSIYRGDKIAEDVSRLSDDDVSRELRENDWVRTPDDK